MKVKELIEELSKLDGDLVVYALSDDEGNSTANIYSPSIRYTVVKKGEDVQEYNLDIDDIYSQETIDDYIDEGYMVVGSDEELKEVVIL